jgi:glyoxylase-like metal-dependent hydrolase (beta-lactamase superfamily II)
MATHSGTYTGDVTPGGTPDVRELSKLIVTKVAVDPEMSNNCYVLRCRATDEQVLIDAAADAPTLLEVLGDAGASKVITTHQHWDHHRALAEIAAVTRPMVVAGAPDAEAISEQTGVAVSRRVGDGDVVKVGAVELEVIAIAGHTPGSICLVHRTPDGETHLWTGDSLFPGGVGATFGDAEAFATLIDEVEAKLFGTLPDETWFSPGHGGDSTLGAARPHLAEWRARGW